MITKTFFGDKVRLDAYSDGGPPTYYVKVSENDNWTTVGEYEEENDYLAFSEARELAKRLQKVYEKEHI